jgi:16S rRNA (uracil1498-N3)-methyltransferase
MQAWIHLAIGEFLMPSERFYIDAELQAQSTVTLEGSEFHHLARVMRVRVGEEVELINGRGALAQAELTEIRKESGSLCIQKVSHSPVLPPSFILAIPVMRPAKLEWVIEKGTELGADAFWLYPADFSEKEELSHRHQERLSHMAISAMKQCGRLDLPPIRVFKHLSDLFLPNFTYFFGDPREKMFPVIQSAAKVFISGPEKGFSKKEMEILNEKAKGVRLSKHILRAETAPIAAAVLFSSRV